MPNESVPSIYNPENHHQHNNEMVAPLKERKPFELTQPLEDELAEYERISNLHKQLAVAVNRRRNLREEGHITEAQFGQAVQEFYIRYLEQLGIGTTNLPTNLQRKSINTVDGFYNRTFETLGANFEIIRIGAVTEFSTMLATQRAIDERNLPLQVLHASPEEDLTRGTDIILDRTDKEGIYGIQTKCLAFLKPPTRILRPINRNNQRGVIEEILTETKDHYYQNSSGLRIKKQSLEVSSKKLFKLEDPEEPVLGRAFITLPSPKVRNYSMFDPLSGIPDSDFVTEIGEELETWIYGGRQTTYPETTPTQNNGITSLNPPQQEITSIYG